MERDVGGEGAADDGEVAGPIDAQGARAGERLVGEVRSGAFGVENDREIGRECRDDVANPLERGRFVVGAGDDAAPAIEDLNRIGTGGDLRAKIRDQCGGEFFEEGVEGGAVGMKEEFDAFEFIGAAALDHIGGEGPRRAAETEEHFFAGEFAPQEGQCGGDVGEFFRNGVGGVERVDLRAGFEPEIHPDAASVAERVALAESLGDHEDVGEENRGVEAGEAMERLERHFGGERGGAHHFKERGLRLERAIFGQVAAGLAHDPERGALEGRAGEGGEETLAGSHGGGS